MKFFTAFILLVSLISPHLVYAGVNTHAGSFASASSQYATKAAPTGLPTGSQARTIFMWVKASTAAEMYAVGYGNGTTPGAFDITVDANLLSVRINGGNHRWTATGIGNGNWHYVAIAYPAGTSIDSSTVKAYMDSSTALSNSSSVAGTPNTNLATGCIRPGADSQNDITCTTSAQFFNGQIDDLQVWSKQLSGAEVVTASDGCNLSDSATNLVGRWRFDNNWNDSTSNANNLTAVNSPTFTTSAAYVCAAGPTTTTMIIKGTKMVIQGTKVIKN